MYERYEPALVPATLPHKEYALPAIGTKAREPEPGCWPDDLDLFLIEQGLEGDKLHVQSQETRVAEWAQTVAAYEANPHNFAIAWKWINTHPIFYKFYFPARDTPTADVIQERHLDEWGGVGRIWVAVGQACSEEECADDECAHPKRDAVMMECGQRSWPADVHDGPEPREGTYSYHDPELDVYGETYEECIMQLAYLVWHNYGNDRVIADTPRKED